MRADLFALLAGIFLLALYEGQLNRTSTGASALQYAKDAFRTPPTAVAHLLLVAVALAGPVVYAVSESCVAAPPFDAAIHLDIITGLLLLGLAWIPLEEFVFRGAALTILRGLFGESLAVYLQAVLFAVAHYLLLHSTGLVYLGVLFLLGLSLGWMRVSYMSLVPGAFVHGIYNLSTVMNAGLAPALAGSNSDCRVTFVSLSLWTVPLVALALAMLLIGARRVLRATNRGVRAASTRA